METDECRTLPSQGVEPPVRRGALWDLPRLLGNPLRFLDDCVRSGKPIVPIRAPFLRAFVLLDADDIERVLVAENDAFVKPLWLRTRAVRQLLGDGLVTSDGEDWRRQRRTCQPAFQPRPMDDYGVVIVAAAKRAIDRWNPGDERDLLREMTDLTIGILAETILGVEIADERMQIQEAMETIMACFAGRYSLFGLLPLPPSFREKRAVRNLDRVVDSIIERARHLRLNCPPTLLTMLLDDVYVDSASNFRHGARHESVREQVKTFLTAGHESSALVLTWLFLMIGERPEIGDQMAAEIRSVCGNGSSGPDLLPRLPYLRAVVKETMRLFPPLWMTGRKTTRALQLNGVTVPAGSLLLTSQWAVQRHPRYFVDPEVFRPERWIGDETLRLPRFAYFPFGGGPRACIGQRFAVMEIELIVAHIVYSYRLETDSAGDVKPWPTMTLRPPSGRIVRLSRR